MSLYYKCCTFFFPINGIHKIILTIFPGWNDDWKPGPYPKTEAERAAAARRYGLLPEDYKPYPDDGTGYGDYPKLPIVSAESRDPYEDFDYRAHRRNFGEPVSD